MSVHKTEESADRASRVMTIANKLGIHARPAAMFAKLANQFSCEILVEKDDETVNAKSIMGLMMLAAGPGSRIRVQATGADAAEALAAIETLIEGRFNEE
ncbi:MAG: HPr family phosphocarrier protein [Verrucomicrobiales bacterium]|nr:HPr family phosphocarrier protein [Verrucomicrobiales bacterium]